ncbi:MAG: penicillin acylase family protein [Cyclobacteriaceae bacterium]|nr:penicillin acylase family protein [Cyclobacteriaceae bacterium]
MRYLFVLCVLTASCGSLLSQPYVPSEIAKWNRQAAQVTIIRDTWGIPHIYGKTDADAVFGFLFAQCEDDFPRVELNYITASGRLAEVEGEEKLYHDLRQRLFYDTLMAEHVYTQSPDWLKRLCNAFADGINYYLYTHPEVKPRLIKRFKPWMPFLFSEGSIGGDIESISVNRLKEFYGVGQSLTNNKTAPPDLEPEPRGSNGFAIAPMRSASGNALLLINPHTSFYFRPEVHVNSKEGLNAYGAVTWGQFFIYQGFNEHCGWMHTSSQADVIDEYLETIVRKQDSVFYQHGNALKPVTTKKIILAYKSGGSKSYKEFVAHFTHHGPVIAQQGDKWISVALMVEPLKALTQSYQRTKAKGYNEYKQVMELKANSSNNTVFADREGNIAYWHGNFIPKRNAAFDWSKPVDGSNPETDWKGLHEVSEIVQTLNPANGWIQNCNSTPFTLAGKYSPDKAKYPAYMAPDAQNARGINAERVLDRETRYTLDKLIAAANDPYLVGFENLLPSLLKAYDAVDKGAFEDLKEPIATLRAWNLNYGKESVGAALAMYWGAQLRQHIFARIPEGSSQLDIINLMAQQTSAEEKLNALRMVVSEFTRDFGKWNVPWGEVNRFQRLTGQINEVYDDAQPSLAVASASSFWGSLAAFGSRKYPGTNKMYGYVGNSFVAVVEFGKTIKAKSVLAGGNSNNPQSPYFTNQAKLYSNGEFKDVLFYKKDVTAQAARTYHPGK